MPSALHESILTLLRDRPSLAAELLRDALAVELPAFTDAVISEANFAELPPTEYRADLVVQLRTKVPVLGIVCEAQLSANPVKRFRWLCYVALLADRWGCPVILLVVTPDRVVATWASQPVAFSGPGSTFVPMVLGPEQVPRVRTDTSVVPELAVLSALAHGNDPGGLETVVAAIQSTVGLDDGRAAFYYDLIVSRLNDATRLALEELMQTQGTNYQSEFARKYFSAGEATGEARGKAEGKAEGERVGAINAFHSAVLELLSARGLTPTPLQVARLNADTDPVSLRDYIRRAALARTLDDVFGPREG